MNHQTSSVSQIAYHSPEALTQPMIEFPQMNLGLAILVFNKEDDLISCLNKAMTLLTAVAFSKFPSTNNQLRNFFNPRNHATIQDVRVTVQQVQGREGQSKGHMARLCTQPKRSRKTGWFKDKAMLAEALKSSQILNEEQLAFLIDLVIPDGQAAQTTILNNVAFQTEDLDAYDFDCDDVSNAKAVLMVNLSNYGFDVISEVPHSKPYHNDMDNQSVHAMHDFEQTLVIDFPDNEITSDSHIIPYSQYLQETQHAAVQDTNLYTQQDSMILSVIEQIVISSQHAVIPVIDDEETLILKKIEALSELPNVSLVNTSLKKLKFHLLKFDTVVKKRITPDAITEGEHGFEQTKAVFEMNYSIFKDLKRHI
uniref:Retrovirus-related Pol polyprotein from transposon TNT 1-94 n=1 Tax=Tanacetum cinerariifolium TaxID=118510 RepID=A0A699JAI5_TANCI|nr:hypothetical protein [Tanacetum cinerariifolium]